MYFFTDSLTSLITADSHVLKKLKFPLTAVSFETAVLLRDRLLRGCGGSHGPVLRSP